MRQVGRVGASAQVTVVGGGLMRGDDTRQVAAFSYISPEQRVPKEHPLRAILEMVDEALRTLGPQFRELYSHTGRPSIPPERLLRALLLQVLYSIRSERMLIEQLEYNLLFRWFVGMGMDDTVWNPSTFSKNRDRLLQGQIADAFFEAVLAQARERDLLSDEHFSVDGTLIQAWASHKSYVAKGEVSGPGGGGGSNAAGNFRGQKRSNATHHSITDPDARLFRKARGHEAQLCYMGHVLLDNRHGLASKARATKASGTAGTRRRRRTAQGGCARHSGHHSRRQELRHSELRGANTSAWNHAPRSAKRLPESTQRHRRQNHSASRLPGQSTQAQADRAGVRLGQDGRHSAQDATPRRATGGLDVHVLGCCLQPRENGQSGGGDMTRRGCTGLLRAAGLAQRAACPSIGLHNRQDHALELRGAIQSPDKPAFFITLLVGEGATMVGPERGTHGRGHGATTR